MKRIFIPFIIYLVMFVILISSIAGDYLKRIKEYEIEHHGTKPYFVVHYVWSCSLLSAACFGFLYYFTKQEIIEFYNSPYNYVSEFWNWFDLLQFWLNLTFLIILQINVWYGLNIVDIHVIRTVGALAGFVMWIKVFYWMRLFKDTSYFIILIMRTI